MFHCPFLSSERSEEELSLGSTRGIESLVLPRKPSALRCYPDFAGND